MIFQELCDRCEEMDLDVGLVLESGQLRLTVRSPNQRNRKLCDVYFNPSKPDEAAAHAMRRLLAGT